MALHGMAAQGTALLGIFDVGLKGMITFALATALRIVQAVGARRRMSDDGLGYSERNSK